MGCQTTLSQPLPDGAIIRLNRHQNAGLTAGRVGSNACDDRTTRRTDAARNQVPAIQDARHRGLPLRRMARHVGRWLDQGQLVLFGDGRALRVSGSGRRENRVERIERDAAGCGRILARENPMDPFCPVGQPPGRVRNQTPVVGHDRFELSQPGLQSTHGTEPPSRTVRARPSAPCCLAQVPARRRQPNSPRVAVRCHDLR
jgi:hypothetical protein